MITMNEWNEITNQSDIEKLLVAYGGFHDACIVSLNFKSGTSVDIESTMHFDGFDKCELRILFHSQCSDRALELCFSGLRRLHLVGVQDNYGNDIYGVSIKFYDNLLQSKCQMPARVIVWADSEEFDPRNIDSPLKEPADTYVIAHKLKWRLTDK